MGSGAPEGPPQKPRNTQKAGAGALTWENSGPGVVGRAATESAGSPTEISGPGWARICVVLLRVSVAATSLPSLTVFVQVRGGAGLFL